MGNFPEIDTSEISSANPPMLPAVRRDWLVFSLASGCLILAGIAICLGIAVTRRYTPKVITKEVIVERPADIAEAPPKTISRTSAALAKHMMDTRGFLISHQDSQFVLLCERENPKRVYVAIERNEDDLITHAETSILMKQANADEASMNHYLLDCAAFLEFFHERADKERMYVFKRMATNITNGIRDHDTFTGAVAQMRFDRGPRDYQDAFILTAKPLE